MTCCPQRTASPRWPSVGCWVPTKARSTTRTCPATWTSSCFGSTGDDPAAVAWCSTASCNSPLTTIRSAIASSREPRASVDTASAANETWRTAGCATPTSEPTLAHTRR